MPREISSCENLGSVVVRDSKVACIKYGGDTIRRFEIVNAPLLTELWIQPLLPNGFKAVVTMFSSVLPQLEIFKLYLNSKISWQVYLDNVLFLSENSIGKV